MTLLILKIADRVGQSLSRKNRDRNLDGMNILSVRETSPNRTPRNETNSEPNMSRLMDETFSTRIFS
ncbi:MAG: hypothetical protein ACLFV6_12280 [Spirulinaceae cyanobacterium]